MPGPRPMVVDVRAAAIPEEDSARALVALAEWARRVRARIDAEAQSQISPPVADSGRMAA